ncbi:Integrase zinc binding domain [Popillia japonica]|uniref:RNA-directed DNA polymerase n=1 Tax=Popillia japonica TaxID=7064 RepID=A0AAW1MGF1_POPJA
MKQLDRVVVPSTLQTAVLEELHRTHIGISKMKQLDRRYVYWEHIDKDIERLFLACSSCVYWEHIDKDIERLFLACSSCAKVKSSPMRASFPLRGTRRKLATHTHRLCKAKDTMQPNESLLPSERNQKKIGHAYTSIMQGQGHHFLVVIDAKSKWPEIEPSSSAPSSPSIKAKDTIF